MDEDGDDLTLAELHERNKPPATTPVAVRLPEPLLAELDEMWEQRDYDSRSEFVRTVLTRLAEDPAVLDDLERRERRDTLRD
jgi:Arc/MetJ-type ribon-helix-helix transcriptional regulator